MTSEVGSDSQRTFRVLMLVPTSFFTDYGCHVSILEEARMPHFLGGRCRLGENQWEDRRRRKPRCAISIAWIYLYASPCPWFGLEACAQVLNYGSLRVHQSFEKIMVSTITMGVQRTKICTTTRFCDRVLLWLLVLCCKKPMGRMIMTKKLTSVSILLSLALMVIPFRAAFAAGSVSLVTEYPLPGSPLHVAVETSGRVWVTLPAENKIARLQVTSPGVYDVHTYQLPTPDSHPYDIVYAAGSVWVTEYTGNKIARFDPVAGTAGEWTEYTIPTTASHPTGLTVLPGDPIQVWFCEQASDKLGLLTITAAGASQFAEFPLPQAWAGAELENIAATSSENVWFTAPGRSGIVQFVLPLWPDRERLRLCVHGPWDQTTRHQDRCRQFALVHRTGHQSYRPLQSRRLREFQMVFCQHPQQRACRPGCLLLAMRGSQNNLVVRWDSFRKSIMKARCASSHYPARLRRPPISRWDRMAVPGFRPAAPTPS